MGRPSDTQRIFEHMFDTSSSPTVDRSDDMSSALAGIEPRITRTDVFEYLARHPGSCAGEIAAGLGVGQGAVSAHLYGGKGRFFVTRAGRWFPVPAADPGICP